jgi:hypothetical protein
MTARIRSPHPKPAPDPVEEHRRRVIGNLDPALKRHIFDEEPLVDNVNGRVVPLTKPPR